MHTALISAWALLLQCAVYPRSECSCTAIEGLQSWLFYVRKRCDCSALDSLKQSFRILRGCRALLLALISACVLLFQCAVYRRSSVHALRLKGALPGCVTFECAVIAVRWIRSNEVFVYFAAVGRSC